MNSYSQGREDILVQEYFGDFVGTLLSCGENDGQTLSNARALIENGWKATLVEPSPIPFAKLCELYIDREDIELFNFAVSNYNAQTVLHDSGSHLHKNDTGLLSSIRKSETEKWRSTTIFDEVDVKVVDVKTLLEYSMYVKFDFISIDCEGEDFVLLQQLNLTALETKLLIIEHNSDQEIKELMISYCKAQGLLNILLENAENILIGK